MRNWEEEDEISLDGLKPCRCGYMPEVSTRFPVAIHKYQGEVECPHCGLLVKGKQWHWSKGDAVDDAIEEWNAMMPDPEVEDESD